MTKTLQLAGDYLSGCSYTVESNINLQQHLGEEITVLLRDGSLVTGVVEKASASNGFSPGVDTTHPYCLTGNSYAYPCHGQRKLPSEDDKDIIQILIKGEGSISQLWEIESEIERLTEKAEKLRKELRGFPWGFSIKDAEEYLDSGSLQSFTRAVNSISSAEGADILTRVTSTNSGKATLTAQDQATFLRWMVNYYRFTGWRPATPGPDWPKPTGR